MFNQFPDNGGLLDQNMFLIDDMITYQQIINVKRKQYEDSKSNG